MKNRVYKNALVVAGTLFALGVVLCVMSLAVKGFDISALSVRGGRFQVEKTIAPEDCGSISLELSVESLSIGPSDDGEAHLYYYDSGEGDYDFSAGGGSTRLSRRSPLEDRRWFEFLSFDLSGADDVILLLPQGAAGELTVDCATGAVAAQGLDIDGELSITSSTGSIAVSLCRAESAELRSSTGAIRVEELDAKSVSLSADTGSISGSLIGQLSDYSVDSRTSTGSNNLTNRSGGSRRLSAETSTGSISIDFTA